MTQDPSDPLWVVEQWQARAWSEGDVSVVDDFAADPLLRHGPSGTQSRSHAEMKDDLRRYQRTICKPDITVHDRVVDGDCVWSRITMQGRNIPTGEPRTLQWLQCHRVEAGRIAELWVLYTTDVAW